MTTLIYGIENKDAKIGPYIKNEEGDPAIPPVKNGYYFFYDRASESTNPYGDSDVLNRYSFNFTIAIYDADTKQLHYVEFDT